MEFWFPLVEDSWVKAGTLGLAGDKADQLANFQACKEEHTDEK